MLITYGSFAYFLYPFLAFAFTAGVYFLLRRRSERVKKIVVFAILCCNFLQHVFKLYLYPQYDGGFSVATTAYNMCALLILLSPVVFWTKSRLCKDAAFYFGMAAGLAAMFVPYWFIGKDAFNWEVYRFYICHGLLFSGAVLPVLLGLHRPDYRNAWKIPFLFFLAEGLILFDNALVIITGNYGSYTADGLYEALYTVNPVWSMHPNEGFGALNALLDALSPDLFWRDASGGVCYWPVFWNAVPLYLAIALGSFLLCIWLDFAHLKGDFCRAKARLDALRRR